MSTFSGIQTALSALQAQRRAMDVTGQNIANANTAGYTRQRADLQALDPAGATSFHSAPRVVGEGVTVTGVSRSYDPFIASRVDQQSAVHADLAGRAATLTSLEGLTTEPTDRGLAGQLDEMWTAWSDVANHPDNTASRAVVLQKTQAVVDALHAGHDAVQTLWNGELTQTDARVTEANQAATSIADLNAKIQLAVASGGSANDLSDRRDQLVTRLGELTGATSQARADGTVDVYLSNNPLVHGGSAGVLSRTPSGSPSLGTVVGLALTVTPTSAPVAVGAPSGELAAALDALGTTLPAASAKYDQVAAVLASSVNGLQAGVDARDAAGAPGTALLGSSSGPVTAGSIALLFTDGRRLAAATAGQGANDSSNATAISKLGTAADGPNTVWKAHVVDLGVRVQAATLRAATVESTLRTAVADQQSSAGVSLDEETSNLLMMQRAYEGAARVMTAVDEALDVLINRTGLVGR